MVLWAKLPARLTLGVRPHLENLPVAARFLFAFEGRSSQWTKVRAAYLKDHPSCECCGSKKNLIVHHKQPFHINPSLELDPTNLITFCENKTFNCHLIVGHLYNFQSFNPNVVVDAAHWLYQFNSRPIIKYQPPS